MNFNYQHILTGFVLAIIWICSYSTALAQEDSVLTALRNNITQETECSKKVEALNSLAWKYARVDSDSAFEITNRALFLASDCNDSLLIVGCYNHFGVFLKNLGEYDSALVYYNMALNIARRQEGSILGGIYNNVGSVYYMKGNYEKALEFYNNALQAHEAAKDSMRISKVLTNMGNIHYYLDNPKKAMECLYRALEMKKNFAGPSALASSYNNLGVIHEHFGQDSLAISYYRESLKNYELAGDKFGMGANYINIGAMLAKDNTKLDEAFAYGSMALDIKKSLNDPEGIAISCQILGNIAFKQNNPELAKKHFVKSLELSQKHGLLEVQKDVAFNLYELYDNQGRTIESFKMYRLYTGLKDSLSSVQIKEKVAHIEGKYKDQKKDLQLAVLEKDKKFKEVLINEQEARMKNQSMLTATLILFVLLLISFALFVKSNLNRKKKDNELLVITNKEVSNQKSIIEQKNKDIMDSMHYARRIQDAILDSETDLINVFPSSFVFFKPRDVVSGDFFWFSEVGEHFIMTCVDCTGHGVPGAFMSVLGNELIHQVVQESWVTAPDLALIELDKCVKRVLKQEGKEFESSDGMDMAMLAINSKKQSAQFCGARRPLVMIRNGELIEIKGSKCSVGGHSRYEKKFVVHDMNLQKNDCIYLFSDGYPDQFGGEKGKKLKYSPFVRLLQNLAETDISQQKFKISEYFDNWKGEFSQVDDVCVIGIRI